MANKEKFKKSLPFRTWFYFRMGWGTYFAFIFAAINTMVVTYYLAIDSVPALKSVFYSFTIYAIFVAIIGIPLLVLAGYIHFKKTRAYASETDVVVESNPYNYKLPPGYQIEVFTPLQLVLSKIILKLALNEKPTKEEINKLNELIKQLNFLIQGGVVGKYD